MINLFIFILSFISILSQNAHSFTHFVAENPSLYKNEICSYNGYPVIGMNNIKCDCYPSYVNEPREKKIKYIGNQMVQCSYQKKKRFKTFFLAGILPMGFDFYYLGYTFYFSLIFIFFILVIASNCFHFYLSYKFDEKSDENKNKTDEDKNDSNQKDINLWYKANKKMDEKDKAKKCLKIYGYVNFACLVILGVYWIVDIVLQYKGIIKDSNGIETDNDISVLFSKEDA